MRSVRVAVVVALAGCPARPPVPPVPPQVVVVPSPAPAVSAPDRAPLIGVLDSVGMILTMPRERQAEEIEMLASGLELADLATDRMRLALLLALADEEVRDTDRARALLEGRTWDSAGYEALARFVLQLVEERSARARDRLDAALALENERRARQELEERLAAIKDIETEIESRDLGGEDGDERPQRLSPEDPVR